ncbi:hypothetical protein ACFV0D_00520 [Streptomyces sp. NPDC059556]|uniref:hypothetical protein n=1 Tax=Streptomyces sp. NPDC059556 TaxID=3346863 RepID=UPI00368009DE
MTVASLTDLDDSGPPISTGMVQFLSQRVGCLPAACTWTESTTRRVTAPTPSG